MADQVTKAAGISSQAAKAKTGKSLDEWFALLDKVGAVDWLHKWKAYWGVALLNLQELLEGKPSL